MHMVNRKSNPCKISSVVTTIDQIFSFTLTERKREILLEFEDQGDITLNLNSLTKTRVREMFIPSPRCHLLLPLRF